MAGRSSKKKQDNFEKIKREMTVKKMKAQPRQNPEITKVNIENEDLVEGLRKEHPETNAKRKEAVIETIAKDKSFVAPGEKLEEDIVEKVKQREQKNTVDTRKVELVVFRVAEEEFALKISNVKEIIRVSRMIKVFNAPQYITGLCTMRGDLLPVIDSRKLFGMSDQEYTESSRIIVADVHGKKVGVLVDKISEVLNIEEVAVKEPPGSIKAEGGGAINGILILNDGKRMVMVLDVEKIIKAGSFDGALDQQPKAGEKLTDSKTREAEEEQIVIFGIDGGEYAFKINYVKEIIRLPKIMKVPNASSYIEGVFSIRNELLPAVNLGKLLGMSCKQLDEYSRVVIIDTGSFSYGVIVDRVSHVVRVEKELCKENGENVDQTGTEFVNEIISLNNGQRMVIMLDPRKLISLEDMKGVLNVENEERKVDIKSILTSEADDTLEYVVFKLGEEEYGIEIHNVQEINRVSEITYFPGAPAFITGMVDLRGELIPILNLRRLFAVHESDSYYISKYLVVEFGNKRIGILIDSVSGVLRFSKTYLEEAPEALKRNGRDCYIDKIIKLNEGKRLVLTLNLSTMLSFM